MNRLLIPLLLLPCSVLADVPDFQCWDIQDNTFSTDTGQYVTRYIDKTNTAYIYITSPDEDNYLELNVSTRAYKNYYYGTRYQDKEGKIYNDIKCKRK